MLKFTRTWEMMSECWQILKADKSLLVLPLISGFCCLLLLISYITPLVLTHHWMPPAPDAGTPKLVAYYGSLFGFYVANYFIIIFFNAAIVACAAERMMGGNPTMGDGLRAAAHRLPVIAGWALVSATVGLLLRIIEDRSDKVGQIIAGLIGAAWTIMTFLVVPIIVIENKNPFSAISDSTAMLKRTWGEQLISNLSFSTVFFVLSLPAILLVGLGIYLFHSSVALIACLVAAGIYFIILSLFQSALQAIFQTALYLYARDGQMPQGFRSDLMEGVFN